MQNNLLLSLRTSHGSLGSTIDIFSYMYIMFNIYHINCIIFKKAIWNNIKAPKPNTEKLAEIWKSSCLFHHSTACSCMYHLTLSITWPFSLLPKEILPQILHVFSLPHPERCSPFYYILRESLAVRAGFISSVVNTVLHVPIVTECFNRACIFTTTLSPASVILLCPNPLGRLLSSTVSHPSSNSSHNPSLSHT